MRQEQINIYQFSELSDEAKAKVLEDFRDINTYDGWWDSIYEGFKENNPFEVGKIYWSGFYSQGDGAMFEYSNYDYKPFLDSLPWPKWKKAIIEASSMELAGAHTGRYYHHNSCHHQVEVAMAGISGQGSQEWYSNIWKLLYDFAELLEEHIKSEYKALCDELYLSLKQEYISLMDDEAVTEAIEANEYEFFENGTKY